MPNALFVYPEFPPSYWGYKYALDFADKKSAMPPLGLLTIAGMFPKNYQLKVVDMNVTTLTDADIDWADVVLTSTMVVQKESLYEVIQRCNGAGVPIVAGGPHPTSYHDNIREETDGEVDHFFFGEVEEIFEDFLTDFEAGVAKDVYKEKRKPDITLAPPPRYDLINIHDYGSMALQFSRGCPFDCEFCDITKLFGRVPRTKSNEQMMTEFDMLHRLGWQGSLFVVDDNFIGNKRDAMRLLPEVTEYQKERDYPFKLFTEASVNLVEIPDMLDAMSGAGFDMVFLGIESPNEDALLMTKKKQNTNKEEEAGSYLLRAIRTIQNSGMEVTGGFIIGMDGDKEFDSHIRFIQEAGVPMAMAGLLTALKETNLYHRLQSEGRLLDESTGNNTEISLNFVPELPREHLISEYRRVVSTLYDPTLENYFERCLTLIKNLKPVKHSGQKIGKMELMAVARSLKRQLFSKQGPAYLRFLIKVIKDYPSMLDKAIRLAIHGYHFEKMTSQTVAVDNFKQYLTTEINAFEEIVAPAQSQQNSGPVAKSGVSRIGEIRSHAQELLARVYAQYEDLHEDFRYNVRDALDAFQKSVFKHYLEAELGAFKETVSRFAKAGGDRISEVGEHAGELLARVHAQYERIHKDFRYSIRDSLISFQESVKSHLDQLVGPVPIEIKSFD
jgi:radical SAM superfamily enzyme YgiQ (UPF0313 family)